MKSSKLKVQRAKSAGVLVLSVLLFCSGTAQAATWQWIDGQQVQGKIKEGSGLWLIDVRSAAAYEAAHIEGSVNIPSDVLAHKKFPAQKAIILVDDSLGQRSAREAAEELVKKGHERVSVLSGGIVAWDLEGLPVVAKGAPVCGVTADELKWAISQPATCKIYDLRDAKEQKQGTIQNSESVVGKTVAERVEKLKSILSGEEKKKDLASRMKKPQTVVLVFSASDDAEGYTRRVLQGMKGDIRYLIGGYEAMIAEKLRTKQTTGACPTCPGQKKKSGS